MNARLAPPLHGPFDTDPTDAVYTVAADAHDGATPFGSLTVRDVAGSMLDTAVNGLPLGAYDALILAWLRNQDLDVMATVASLLRRAWLAGVETGHDEALDETRTAPEVEGLRLALACITAAAWEADRQLGDETADRQDIAEALIGTVETATRGAR